MNHKPTRRAFLKTTTLTGLGLVLNRRAPAIGSSISPSEKLNIGVVGVSGRGHQNLGAVSDENIVALCDIDEKNLHAAAERFPHAKRYQDFRHMLDTTDLDAVVVSTPDHTHAVVTVASLKSGKHVYCEKPLTHSVHEAHVVAATTKKHRAATQMGTQIHAGDNYRRVVELINTGAIGHVREAHAWVGKGWGGGERPATGQPLPSHIDYDVWLGPAPERPYHSCYLPRNWRRWWDFGGGTLADMGCHYLDLIHWALDLRNPIEVEAEGPPVHPETAPEWLIVRYRHTARGSLPPVDVTWHDGGKRPPYLSEGQLPEWRNGVLFVGDEGMLLAGYSSYVLLPEKKFADFSPPRPSIPPSIGHHAEWIEACKTGAPTTCNFDYSGALAETALLGVVAYRSGKSFVWNRHDFKTSEASANKFLRREYRKGWSL